MTAVAQRGTWSMPDAKILLPADAPRERWLGERRKGVGGSDASTVAGVNPFGGGRYELWLDKTGRLDEREVTPRMEAGTRLEPVLRQWFTDATGIGVRRQGLAQSKARPWQRVSLDGLTEDGGIFESKCTGWWLRDSWADGQVADHAEVQIQHGLAVTGRSHGWAVVLIDGWDFQVRRVERDEKLIELITSMEGEFWREHVLADVEPPADAQSLDVIKRRFASIERESVQVPPDVIRPLITDLAAGKAAEKAAKNQAKEAEARIRALIGGAEVALIGDQPVASLPLIERGGYTVAPTSFRQLKIVKEK